MNAEKRIYISGAGGLGNIGAESILLAIIKLFQNRYGSVRFILSAWHPERIREILKPLQGDFEVIGNKTPFSTPSNIRKADLFVVCGDVALSESVLPFLPAYWAIRAMTAKLLRKKVIFLGIEAEKIRNYFNRLSIRLILSRSTDFFIVRNRTSLDNLREMDIEETSLLLGCEPALMIEDSDIEPFSYRMPGPPKQGMLAGFALRDFFSRPLSLDPFRMKLRRTDCRPGEISPEMNRIILFTARLADHLADQYGARLIFIPHHFLDKGEQVILPDIEIIDRVVSSMKYPGSAVIAENNLHPYTVMSIYRDLDLAVSMRHHANSFAYLFGVPVIGYAMNAKIRNFFSETGKNDMLVNPLCDDFEQVKAIVDAALINRKQISSDFREGLALRRTRLLDSLNTALM